MLLGNTGALSDLIGPTVEGRPRLSDDRDPSPSEEVVGSMVGGELVGRKGIVFGITMVGDGRMGDDSPPLPVKYAGLLGII